MILQTPAGLTFGDQFRFVFVTDGDTTATSTNISDYDNFVQSQAGGATYNGVVVNWLAIGSTESVNAIDHIEQTSTPVYLANGTLVTNSTTAAGLWSAHSSPQLTQTWPESPRSHHPPGREHHQPDSPSLARLSETQDPQSVM